MHKFALREISVIKGRIALFALTIDGVDQLESFFQEIEHEGNLRSQIRTIISRLEMFSQLIRMPSSKFKDITPDKEIVKEFEVKTKDLRVYMIRDQQHIVVLGGKKNSQRRDINKFRSIKRLYLQNKTQWKT